MEISYGDILWLVALNLIPVINLLFAKEENLFVLFIDLLAMYPLSGVVLPTTIPAIIQLDPILNMGRLLKNSDQLLSALVDSRSFLL
jgi:hypothetical protein